MVYQLTLLCLTHHRQQAGSYKSGYFFMIDVNRSDSKSRCSHACKRR